MTGIPGALFFPLALAIAFSMITSYLLAQTFVPIMGNWLMKSHYKMFGKKKSNENISEEEDEQKTHFQPLPGNISLEQAKTKLLQQNG